MYQEINIISKASGSSRESGHMGGGGGIIGVQREMKAASMIGRVVMVVVGH